MTSPASAELPLPVSVVIPAFNVAATLERAVRSVLAQTRRPSEIILVDDASTDATWSIAQRLADEVHEVIPMRTRRLLANAGAGAARNAGWDLAQGEYIAFLDADDAWHPRKLEIQAGWMMSHPDVVLCGHRCVVLTETSEVPVLPATPPAVRVFDLRGFLVRNRFSTPSVMLKRDVNARFAAGKRYSEDYLLWLQVVAGSGAASHIDLPLAFLFKDRYGVSGLSGSLWRMQLGELDTLARLRRQSIINAPQWLAWIVWSWTKFCRRLVG